MGAPLRRPGCGRLTQRGGRLPRAPDPSGPRRSLRVRIRSRRRHAVQAHGILERPSEDVDLFTTITAQDQFPDAVRAAIASYTGNGLTVEVLIENPGFARLSVTDPAADRTSKVELGVDWRQYPPITLSIGPVLARDDAVANKVCALYSRGQARDYIDVDAALRKGGYTPEGLLILAAEHDRGFDRRLFADSLRAVERLPLAEFTAYGLTTDEASAVMERSRAWADQVRDSL